MCVWVCRNQSTAVCSICFARSAEKASMVDRAALALALLIIFQQNSSAISRQTRVVRTQDGPVRGWISRTVWNLVEYAAFKGIPYAEPPLGDLRFKPPVPVKPWTKVLKAFYEGNMCPQVNAEHTVYSGHEDCLYLNVFTPEVKFRGQLKLRPVMVWIHGGAYMTGSGNSDYFGPDFFLEENVVMVTFNYRLGVLGFLALKHPKIVGNAGLKDQNLVLKWVKSNIAFFGGDPKRVTVFGESAGSTSIGFHMLSERSRGLFLRSISMSGTPLCPWAYHTPKKIMSNAYKLASTLHFTSKDKEDLVKFFLKTPVEVLMSVGAEAGLDYLPFRPTLEDPAIDPTNETFLSECPITKYKNGDFYHHDMMMGYTHDEVLLFIGPPLGLANSIDWAKRYVENVQKQQKSIASQAQVPLAKLIDVVTKNTIDPLLKSAMSIFFSGPIDLTQRLLAKQNHNHDIYYYRLSYISKYSIHRMKGNPLNGTAHSDDIGYIFNVKSLRAPTNPKNSFNQFRKQMVTMWANFAKYGNPTPKNMHDGVKNVTWLPSNEHGFQLDIDKTCVLHTRLIQKKTEAFEKSLYITLPLISACVHKSNNSLNLF